MAAGQYPGTLVNPKIAGLKPVKLDDFDTWTFNITGT